MKSALLALFFVQIFFATFPIFGKIAMREVSPLVVASFRAAFGAIFLSLAARWASSDEPPFSRREHFTLFVLSMLGIVSNQIFFISGLARTSAIHASLIVATIPAFTVLVGVVSGRERPGLRRIFGVPIAFLGILFLLGVGRTYVGAGSLAGDLLIAVNCLCYSMYLVGARDILAKHSAISVIAALFRYGALPILLFAIPALRTFEPSKLSAAAAWSIAAIVIFATVLAYFLNAWALARTDASTAAIFVYIQPLIAGTLAWLVLGERPGPRTGGAALLILAGVALTTWPGRVRRPTDPLPEV
ncbi:MAG: DMT family transporter [Thermoanaerobaculia bacterium]